MNNSKAVVAVALAVVIKIMIKMVRRLKYWHAGGGDLTGMLLLSSDCYLLRLWLHQTQE